MAEIQPISNGESGSSTRSKINDSFIQANVLINGVDTRTGSTLLFDNLLGSIYNAAAPSSANITLDATGALVGAVVAFYNDGTVEPTITGATPNPAAGTWQSGKVNAYWFMWDGTNFTQNIQTQLVVLPQLTAPTYTLVQGSSLEIDYSFQSLPNATGAVFEISTDVTFATLTEAVAGFTFPNDGAITTFSGSPLVGGTTYYTRLKTTASNYEDSDFVFENETPSVAPTLAKPTLSVTPSNTQNSINRIFEDSNADGGSLEFSLDGSTGWSAVGSFVWGTNPTVHGSINNYEAYFYRYKSTKSGYNDSPYSDIVSGTPSINGVNILFADQFTGTQINTDKWTPTDTANCEITQNGKLEFTDLQTASFAGGCNASTDGNFNMNTSDFTDIFWRFDIDQVGGLNTSNKSFQFRIDDNNRVSIAQAGNNANNTFFQKVVNGTPTTQTVTEELQGSFKLERNSTQWVLYKWNGSAWASIDSFANTNLTNGFVEMQRNGGFTTGQQTDFDNVFVTSDDYNTLLP